MHCGGYIKQIMAGVLYHLVFTSFFSFAKNHDPVPKSNFDGWSSSIGELTMYCGCYCLSLLTEALLCFACVQRRAHMRRAPAMKAVCVTVTQRSTSKSKVSLTHKSPQSLSIPLNSSQSLSVPLAMCHHC